VVHRFVSLSFSVLDMVELHFQYVCGFLYMIVGFRYMTYVILLATSKFARSCGIYLSYDLLKFVHVIQLLFFIKIG